MNRERWIQVKPLLDQAIALPSQDREAFLNHVCNSDSDLRQELESLLAGHDEAGTGFLETPAINLSGERSSDFEPAPKRIGSRIGAYDILEQIGHGGMGEVYRAVRADGQFTKEVAIKMVRGGFDTAAVVERFRHERQILASLDHPNIARLLDGGTTDAGTPYLVMELIEGTPIDRYCDAHRLSISERLRLFLQVCSAVQYAHQRLVIHRDIKPGNILVTEEGVPKLLDFGIAKIFDPAAGSETTLAAPMTPEYASPEQIRGEPITTATDVYSLGVVLYLLLTARSPYPTKTTSAHELARSICDIEPERPSTIVLKTV
ncbi:MAG TPA: serine/threonine-protein kinase [Verrucomicrobiae bacterium]|nr:serine/threonine-protein kinase [Verrucomicrobiae bacterium]